MQFHRKVSNIVTPSSVQSAEVSAMFVAPAIQSPVVNSGANNMQTTIAQTTVNTNIQAIFDARRVWTPNGWEKRVNFSEEEINTFSPEGAFMKAFEQKRIRVTQSTNATRADGIPVVFSNSVQDKALGAAFALLENIPYYAEYMEKSDGLRVIALVDTTGNHDVQVVEERDEETGHVRYNVFYASKAYNNQGDLIGLRRGAINQVQEGIKGQCDGWTDKDGKVHTGYNQWVDKHNAAVMTVANKIATAEQIEMCKGCTADADPNKYVQINTVKHVAYESVVNKYVLLAWMLLDEQRPSFELFTFAKTAEGFQKWLSNRESGMVWGYQNQLKRLAGIVYQPVTE